MKKLSKDCYKIKDSKPDKGWVCPKCGTVYAPFVASCSCFKHESKRSDLQDINE